MKAIDQIRFPNPPFYPRQGRSSQQSLIQQRDRSHSRSAGTVFTAEATTATHSTSQAVGADSSANNSSTLHTLLKRGLLLALLLCSSFGSALATSLPAPVVTALAQARISHDAVAIWVQPVDGTPPTLQFNAGTPFNPASVMKLVTAFASFEHFGPAYSWQTRLASTQPIETSGDLNGDLYLIGSGDPLLDHPRLLTLLRRLRALGLQRVNGDLVLDASVLQLPAHDPAAFDGRGLRPYNSGPHGLLLNFNSLLFQLHPGRPQQAVQAIAEPALTGLSVHNQIRSVAGPCQVWHRDLDARFDGIGNQLILSGSMPASCGARTWSAAPLPPPAYAEALVRSLWQELGGSVTGQVRHGKAPAQVKTLLSHDSPPLAEIVREMNKWSSNLIARQLIADLAVDGKPGSGDMVSTGVERAHALLTAAAIDTRGLVIENGAGLSRIARIRADSLGQLLIRAWQRPWMPEFIAALPIAGVDGTARRHLDRSPARGQAHLKTGTINGVRAIGGYVLDRHGRRQVVVMMINHPQAQDGGAALDALLEWVWAGADSAGSAQSPGGSGIGR